MWYVLFMAFFGLAILLFLLAIKLENHDFCNITFSMISAGLWLILTLDGMKLEFPYQFYNSTTDAVELGYNFYTSPVSWYVSYLFLLMFWIVVIYLIAMVWDKWYNYKNWHGGN